MKRKNTRIIHMQIKRRLKRNHLSLFICIHGLPLLMRFLVFFPLYAHLVVWLPWPADIWTAGRGCYIFVLRPTWNPCSAAALAVYAQTQAVLQPALALHLPPSSSLWWRRRWLFLFFSSCLLRFQFFTSTSSPPGDCASCVPSSYGCGAELNLPSHWETCGLLVK